MSEIINVKYKAPQIPCIAFDEYYQVFILRDMVIATDEHGKKNMLQLMCHAHRWDYSEMLQAYDHLRRQMEHKEET